ncbi:MAG: glycosyltransferase family 4 protein [Conexivisphaerales archaeon]
MKLRICYVVPDVHIPNVRGASTHVLELSLAFSRLGDEVHVICRRSPHEKGEEIYSGISLHRLYRGVIGPLSRREALVAEGKNELGVTSLGYSLYLKSIYSLYAGLETSYIAKVNRSDFIIERETAFGAGALASKLLRKPLVLELIGPKYSQISMSESKFVIAYNEKMVPEYAKSKTIYVKAAVNTTLFRPDRRAREAVRKMLGMDDATMIVGYVGTFQSWHGIDDLVRVAEHFRTRKDVKFLLVGPLHTSASNSYKTENIIMTGPVPYPLVYRYINAFDIAVAPYNLTRSTGERRSKGMGSPLKVLEYMACAKPCVASSVKQVTEILEDGFTGKIYPEGDVHSLAVKIEELLKDEDERRRIGENALRVAQSYTWDKLAEKIHASIESHLKFRN